MRRADALLAALLARGDRVAAARTLSGGAARSHPPFLSAAVGPHRLMTLNLHSAATMSRRMRVVALFLILLMTFDASAAAARRKRRSSKKRRAVVAAPAEIASGTTLEERLASLVNSKTAGASETSIEIVEVESGTVIAER